MAALIGLVTCGGKSSRMDTDKCLLEYHGQPQWNYIYKLVQPFCEKVLISCNKSQIDLFPSSVKYITDKEEYFNIGPMAALLSAFSDYPTHDFLLVGCDYPFLDQKHVMQLFNSRNENKKAFAFYNRINNIYEPLLAIYKNECYKLIYEHFQKKEYSLCYLLEEISAAKVNPESEKAILSVDDRAGFNIALNELKLLSFGK